MADELSAEQMLAEVSKETAAPQETESNVETSTNEAGETTKTITDPKTGQTFTYTTDGGKEVTEPLEMVLKRAGMGYHYAQKMHQLNQQAEKYKGYDERIKSLSRWEEYDKYAATNPDWAKHVEESWNNRTNYQQPNPESQKIQELEKKLADLYQFREEVERSRTQERYAQEDKQFSSEIQSVGKNFGVDLDQADEQGRSLEWRVLAHMEKIGLDGSKPGHFTAAFKDYYFDNLLNRQKDQVKEGHSKEKAELKRAGILDISRTPKASNSKGYRPGMSYDQLSEMALAEIRAQKA